MNTSSFLRENKLSSCVFSTSSNHVNENFYYFAGLSKTSQVTATLILTSKGPVILTNKLEHKIFRGKGKLVLIETRKDVEDALKKYCSKKIGTDFSYTTASRLSRIKKMAKGRVTDVSKWLGEMRAIKSVSEIKKIEEACKITEDALDGVEKLLKNAKTEQALALELEYAARKNGAEAIAYPPIVAHGKNSALAHHIPDKTKLKNGLLLIDFGVVYDGYCSDTTRVFSIGAASEKIIKIYETVHMAQQASIKLVKNGSRASDVHIAADNILQKELKQKLIHSIGHGLGVEVHDYPEVINSKSKIILKNNMVITIEPGYYNTHLGGIRIEDDVVVGNRPKLLSKAPSSIIEL